MQNLVGGSMRGHTLLAMFVALLVVRAYGAYVVSYPKYPEVKGCVNPFAVTKPIGRVQENWSKVHVFFKLATSRDFWKLAKPWQVDYSHVRVVKHTIDYNGEKVTMLAMGIPLRDKKHVIAIYEFSKPIKGVKLVTYEYFVNGSRYQALKVGINGDIKTLSSCTQECQSNSDCGAFGKCNWYCCSINWALVAPCCWQCVFAGTLSPVCALTACPACVYAACSWGSYCSGWTPGP